MGDNNEATNWKSMEEDDDGGSLNWVKGHSIYCFFILGLQSRRRESKGFGDVERALLFAVVS